MKLRKNLQLALAATAVLWFVYYLNFVVAFDLRIYGLRPRHLDGLRGILAAPFLHANFAHLVANTGAFLVLLTVSLSFSHRLTIKALLIIVFVGGGLVWIFERSDTIHIGASGIIFGLIGFLMFLGFFRKEWTALAISAAILFFYGGALFALFVYVPGISWTGHFFGFMSGVLAAWWTRVGRIK